VLTVSPHPPPTATIVANPASIYVGGSSSLTVSALYATKVTMKSSDGATYTLAPSGGLQGVTPTATTTYVVTATGPYGTVFVSATVTVSPDPQPAVSIVANPSTIVVGHQAFLSVVASNATQVVITGSDGSSFTLAQAAGGTQAVSPAANTTYTATATGMTGTTPATAATTVQTAATGSLQQIDHVVFMLQENRSFDTYFGMLNPYRRTQGWNIGDDGQQYTVDGIDDKLTSISNSDREGTAFPLFKLNSTCIDETSPFWTSSYQDVSINNYGVHRPINMNGFVEQAEGYTQQCQNNPNCSGDFTDTTGQRAMGYYDQDYLNYYYYMASQFAVSDRWFSPIATWTFNNRIATFSGGTTQGLVSSQGSDDLPQLNLPSIFQELDEANVSWKIYYTVTNGLCTDQDDCSGGTQNQRYPATNFSDFTYSYRYIYEKTSTASCVAPTRPSSVVGDSTNSFCVDPTHIAPIANYYTDLANGTLPSFTFIEAGYGNNDEHPGSGQSIFTGQAEVAKVVNALMGSYLWNDSVFFFSFDEGGGLYDHVPPVPGYSNQNTATSLGTIPDIGSIAVNPDSYNPCLPPTAGTATIHCDLLSGQPGASSTDTVGVNGFAAQLGFRLPNIVISPFTRKHYVSHIPMDHTAVIKFVENRFIGSAAHLTARDAAQPDLLDFFDFSAVPWSTPPSPPTPMSNATLGYAACTPTAMQ
jgi:phospholipase C